MAKRDKRKTIMVEEVCFKVFDERRKALKMNSSELLETLLSPNFEQTIKISREPDSNAQFEKNIESLNKLKGW